MGTTTMTIAEGMAELKTIPKRLRKKREFVLENIARPEMLADPHAEEEGGQAGVVQRGLQSIWDMEQRYVRIRRAILQANLATEVTVGEGAEAWTMCIQDWLTWRREIAQHDRTVLNKRSDRVFDEAHGVGRVAFYNQLKAQLQSIRSEALKKDRKLVQAEVANPYRPKPENIVVNMNEVALAEQVEHLETILGELDGRLSVVNATTSIEVED